MDNFNLRKYLAEGKLLKEALTPRYSEGEISIEQKIEKIILFWKEWTSAMEEGDRYIANVMSNKITLLTAYEDESGKGGSYASTILDNAKTPEDVEAIIRREEAKLMSEDQFNESVDIDDDEADSRETSVDDNETYSGQNRDETDNIEKMGL